MSDAPRLALLPRFPAKGLSPNARGVGCWRLQPGGMPFPGLPAAIAAVRRGHPDRRDLHALAWLLMPRLPGKPLASDSLKTAKARSDRLPLEDAALTHPWLGMNTGGAVNVLWVESDKASFRALLDQAVAAGLPRPAWTASGRCGGHAAWILRTPVVLGLDGDLVRSGKMRRLLSVTHSYLCTAIDGDRNAAVRGMTKNPWHPSWMVEVGDLVARDLKDLLRPLKALAEAEGWEAPQRRTREGREREPNPEGRNSALFDMLRWWAADEDERDGAVLLDKAVELNAGFPVPLGHGEVACVARSVTRGMADGRCRARCRLSPAEVRERQVAAGRAAAQGRADDRDDRIRGALATLADEDAPVSQAAVARLAGCDPRTVRRSPAWAEAMGGADTRSTPSGSRVGDPLPDACLVVPQAPPLRPVTAPTALALPPASAFPLPWGIGTAPQQADRAARRASLASVDALTSTAAYWTEAAQRRAAIQACPVADPAAFLAEVEEAARREELADPWSRASMARRRRRDSRRRCQEREAWHTASAQGGLRAYRDAVAARYAALFRERSQAVTDYPDPHEDPLGYMAARESSDPVRMAWAAKLKAEHRISRRWDDTLQAQEQEAPRPRMRTVMDGIDRIAARLSITPEEAMAEGVRARARARARAA